MRRGHLVLTTALALATLIPAFTVQAQEAKKEAIVRETKADDEKPVVIVETSAGSITIQLDRAKAPITVENFLKYVDSNFYDGLVFHRVIPGFMIQGGGMTESNGTLREKRPSFPPIKNESRKALSNARGTIAMARTGDPNSATSQFFINHDANTQLDTYGGGYTAFGKVIDGMDVVDAIAKAKTDMSEGRGGVPLAPIVIKSVKRKS